MPETLTHPETTTARWKVTIWYRSESGLIDVEHGIEELEELQDIVERGADWNTIEQIVVVLNRCTNPGMTVEQANG